jgi:chromosomal replication initiator protein
LVDFSEYFFDTTCTSNAYGDKMLKAEDASHADMLPLVNGEQTSQRAFENSATGSHDAFEPAEPTPEAALADAWGRIKRRLRIEFGEDVFSSWFARLDLDTVRGESAHLSVPTRFLKSWIEAHYCDRIVALFKAETSDVKHVQVSVRGSGVRDQNQGAQRLRLAVPRSDCTESAPSEALASPAERSDMEWGGNALDPRLGFETFLVGRSNALAHAAAERIAHHESGPALYNPLYIHANVGLGKTHLLQAIGNQAIKNGKRVIYLTAERFMYGFVAALKAQTAMAFKERLRAIDVLIIDDVQFLQGKSISQEFGHTINALIDAGKQIVVAADRPPSELEAQDDRVRSRLAGGLAVEMASLDEELRVRILTARITAVKAAHPSFQVSDAVIALIARSITTNGRDLDGAVNRLLAHATLSHGPITLETAENAIRDLVKNREPKRVKIEDIQKLVANRYNVSRADILSERRTAAVVRPRQIAMYLSKSLTLRSLPEIGRRFGGRDHTTVLHAVRKIEQAIPADQALCEEIELLKRMLQD